MTLGVADNMTVNGQVIRQSLIITAALPQVLLSCGLYLLLGLSAFIICFRTPGTPFTLAGVLMMRSKLTTLHLFPDEDDKKGDELSGSGTNI